MPRDWLGYRKGVAGGGWADDSDDENEVVTSQTADLDVSQSELPLLSESSHWYI